MKLWKICLNVKHDDIYVKRFLKYSLSLHYTLPFLTGLTVRLEDSITVITTGIYTKIFFTHAVKYKTNRPYAN